MVGRQDINHISAAELEDYIHALGILRARSLADPDDVTGYDYQAALHNDTAIGPCEHGNDLFLPWHRCHLYHFEKLLRATDPPRTANVRIPYWDWLQPEDGQRKFPARFYVPGLDANDRDEISEPLPPDTLKIVVETNDQMAFAGYPEGHPQGDYGSLEDGPHNTMHPFYIGGRMALPSTAAQDPIYWSFHAFIDLLWEEWQRRWSDPPLTSPNAPLRGFPDQALRLAGDFRRTSDLDARYELTPRLRAAFAVPSPPPRTLQLASEFALRPSFRGPLSAELEANGAAAYPLGETIPDGAAIKIRLNALAVPITGSYALDAYLHPAAEHFDPLHPAGLQPRHVGYVTLWRMHPDHADMSGHGDHDHAPDSPPGRVHHPTSATVRFDITKALRTLQGHRDLVVTLTYRLPPDRPGQPPSPPALVREIRLRDVSLEVYS